MTDKQAELEKAANKRTNENASENPMEKVAAASKKKAEIASKY